MENWTSILIVQKQIPFRYLTQNATVNTELVRQTLLKNANQLLLKSCTSSTQLSKNVCLKLLYESYR